MTRPTPRPSTCSSGCCLACGSRPDRRSPRCAPRRRGGVRTWVIRAGPSHLDAGLVAHAVGVLARARPVGHRGGAAAPGPARWQRPAVATRALVGHRPQAVVGGAGVLRRPHRAEHRARSPPRRGAPPSGPIDRRPRPGPGPGARVGGRSDDRVGHRRRRRARHAAPSRSRVGCWSDGRAVPPPASVAAGARCERDRHRLVAAHEVGGTVAGLVVADAAGGPAGGRRAPRTAPAARGGRASCRGRSACRNRTPRGRSARVPCRTCRGRGSGRRPGWPTGRACRSFWPSSIVLPWNSTVRVAVRAMFLIGLTQRSISSTAGTMSARSACSRSHRSALDEQLVHARPTSRDGSSRRRR